MAIIQGIGIGTVLYVLLAHINCVDFNQRVGIHIAIGVISFILLTIVPDLEALLHLEDITTFY